MEKFKKDFFRMTGKRSSFINMLFGILLKKEIRFLFFYRTSQKNIVCKLFFKCISNKLCLEINSFNIAEGLFIAHPFCITINPNVIIGKNCNIHKGVTIGQENRGYRKGTPTIGDNVWIGVNATIVGNIKIGNDVLIAPNTYINCDIPSHTIVYGNPCVLKASINATEFYINRKV